MSQRKFYFSNYRVLPYGYKPQMSFSVTSRSVKLWAELSTYEKEQWRNIYKRTSYGGFIGAYFTRLTISSILKIYYKYIKGEITEEVFKSLVPEDYQNWKPTFEGG